MFDTRVSRRQVLALTGTAVGAAALGMPRSAFAADITLRYGHMNQATSINGLQAVWFADEVAKNTGGKVKIEVFPSSQLGSIKELAEGVSAGTIALSHNTAGALAPLYDPISALDTPYLYRNVDHLMKVVASDSPVMESLNKGLIAASGVRVLYAFYFGTRQLTANQPIMSPADLSGKKIRAIPSPIYLTTVEGLGAVAIPMDWSQVSTALATGEIAGQENPVNTILQNKLFDVQKYIMMTGHISSAELVLVNEDKWQSFSPDIQAAFNKAAETVRARATKATLDSEASDLQALKDHGMKVIDASNGLQLDKFKASVKALIDKKFGEKYGDIYKQIDQVA